MAPHHRDYSPVLAMSPTTVQPHFAWPSFQGFNSSWKQPVSWPRQPLRTCAVAGRKRSRDEAAVNLDPPEKTIEPVVVGEAEDQSKYGPGMVPINKSVHHVTDASSQSGTWVQETAAREQAQETAMAFVAQQQAEPSTRSNKSQRLDMITPPVTPGEGSLGMASSLSVAPAQPVVDDFTRHLGIGWSRIKEDGDTQAAARGWARYIENHFPVTKAHIRLESRGLQSYLVEAAEGFFLFDGDLRHGRLVSKTAERMLENLKSSPPLLDGPATMQAVERAGSTRDTTTCLSATPAVEMDMS